MSVIWLVYSSRLPRKHDVHYSTPPNLILFLSDKVQATIALPTYAAD
jgi:hypothetical protein